MGHCCRICGRERANEQFSGKGHKTHVALHWASAAAQYPVQPSAQQEGQRSTQQWTAKRAEGSGRQVQHMTSSSGLITF